MNDRHLVSKSFLWRRGFSYTWSMSPDFLLQQRAVFGLDFGVFWGDDYGGGTLSSVSRLRSLTPEVLRPAERMVLVSTRMILPNWEMSIISVVSPTRLTSANS
jgi:hypothetical protein